MAKHKARPIADNVLASNNIVSRNTFFVDPLIIGQAPDNDGDTPTDVIHPGKESVILIANNNNHAQDLNIVFAELGLGDVAALNDLMKVELITGNDLWQRWESTGFEGQGISIKGEHLIEVTDLNTAKLLNIPFDITV